MSGGGFHAHGPHDHELEHAGAIAVVTAIIATIGATFAYMGGATQANAGLYKNNAAIRKLEPPTSGTTIRPRAASKT